MIARELALVDDIPVVMSITTQVLALTRPTSPSSVGFYVGVGIIKHVPARTVSYFVRPVMYVFQLGARFQVIWVHATTHVASMSDNKPIGDWADES